MESPLILRLVSDLTAEECEPLTTGVNDLYAAYAKGWLPGMLEPYNVTFSEAFKILEPVLCAMPDTVVPSLEDPTQYMTCPASYAVEIATKQTEEEQVKFLEWTIATYPPFQKYILQRLVTGGFRNQYYLLYRALSLDSFPMRKRQIVSPLYGYLLGLQEKYPYVERLEQAVVERETERRDFPTGPYNLLKNYYGVKNSIQALASVVNHLYSYKQQERLGRLLSVALNGVGKATYEDIRLMLRSVKEEESWLPGLNHLFRLEYCSVFDVLKPIAAQAFKPRELRALIYYNRSRPKFADMQTCVQQLTSLEHESYDKITHFMETCFERHSNLIKDVRDTIKKLKPVNAFQLKHQLSTVLGTPVSPKCTPFHTYLKKLMREFPGLPGMLETLLHLEMHYGRLKELQVRNLLGMKAADAALCAVDENGTTKPSYTFLQLSERTINNLVTLMCQTYSYDDLCACGQTIALALVPTCRFQIKYQLEPSDVRQAVVWLDSLRHPLQMLTKPLVKPCMESNESYWFFDNCAPPDHILMDINF
ncbi:ORF11 [Ranid herpesvirus 2]|uniref:ORF11 n=1 Tax=Ranid herpesvirus 2 TaxID=389214 RepID=Q14W95_9VIRU|nr:ORF11 [Ranid herpesvirus 2]ABG25567.1 ORF11 [Ranid herpesvirus 2]